MKAVLCKRYGPPESLTFEELPSPRAGPGEAVVTVRAASVNFPDVLIIQDKLPLNLALLKGAAVVGVFWGDFARREPRRFAQSMRQLARWYGEGKLRPHVSQTFPLHRAAEALKLMAARQVKGKVVLTNEE